MKWSKKKPFAHTHCILTAACCNKARKIRQRKRRKRKKTRDEMRRTTKREKRNSHMYFCSFATRSIQCVHCDTMCVWNFKIELKPSNSTRMRARTHSVFVIHIPNLKSLRCVVFCRFFFVIRFVPAQLFLLHLLYFMRHVHLLSAAHSMIVIRYNNSANTATTTFAHRRFWISE